MNIKSKINQLIKPNSFVGLDCFFKSDGTTLCHGAILKKKNKAIQLVDTFSIENGLDAISTKFDLKIPLVLILNGKGVLNKKVEVTGNDNETSLLSKVLPNAKLEDFVLFQNKISDTSSFVSIIRKSTIADILNQLSKQKINISTIEIGPFACKYILPLIEEDEDYNLFEQSIQVNHGAIIQVKNNPQEEKNYNVSGEKIGSNYLIPFAAAFKALMIEYDDDIPQLVNNIKERFNQKQLFQVAGRFILVFFFVLLWGNYFLFNYFNQERDNLRTQSNTNSQLNFNLNKLDAELKQKKLLVEKTGLLKAGHTSFYADQLAQSIPSSILLSRMQVNPIFINPNDDKDLTFSINKIVLNGNCKKNTELNEWIKTIKQINWVKEVVLNNFQQNKEMNTGEFNLEITTH